MSTGGAYNNPLAPPADGDFFDDLDAFWDVVGTGGGGASGEEDGSGMDSSALDVLMGLAAGAAPTSAFDGSPAGAGASPLKATDGAGPRRGNDPEPSAEI